MKNPTHTLFVVKNERIHRTSCKRVNLDGLEQMTARLVLESGETANATPATCCKPAQSPEWKATVETLAEEENMVSAMEARLAAEESAEGTPREASPTAARDADKAAEDARYLAEQAAAEPAEVVKAVTAPRRPRGTAPEAGTPEDMGRKMVRAGDTRVAYVSRTPRATGAGYVAGTWETADGAVIDWTWKDNWTVTVAGASYTAPGKTLTSAVAFAANLDR